MTRVPQKIREQVQKRASGDCEYCRKPEVFSAYSFHVDHIIPVKRHNGSEELYNLAWACFDCNTFKGTDIAAYDEITKELTPLYNPRTQQWDDHFEMNGLLIVGKTSVGRVTVRILQMNDPERIELRRNYIEE
jgi:5-methylcytosine-specific restriction endonuclease McrA